MANFENSWKKTQYLMNTLYMVSHIPYFLPYQMLCRTAINRASIMGQPVLNPLQLVYTTVIFYRRRREGGRGPMKDGGKQGGREGGGKEGSGWSHHAEADGQKCNLKISALHTHHGQFKMHP